MAGGRPPFDFVRALLTAAGLADDIVPWPDVEAVILTETNAARRQQRRTALGWHAGAAAVARRHAEDLLRRRYFNHTTPEGWGVGDRLTHGGVRWRSFAENLFNQPTSSRLNERQMLALGKLTVDTWLRSGGHRRNLLLPKMTGLGVGVVATSRNVIAVQIFVS